MRVPGLGTVSPHGRTECVVTTLLCGAPQFPAHVQKYKEMESGHKVKHHPHGQEMLGRNAPQAPGSAHTVPGTVWRYGWRYLLAELRRVSQTWGNKGNGAQQPGSAGTHSPGWEPRACALLPGAVCILCKSPLR